MSRKNIKKARNCIGYSLKYKIVSIYILIHYFFMSFDVLAEGVQFSVSENGVPIYQIARPNERGVSYNVFQEFHVHQKGLVFNNQNNYGNSQLAGMIGPNPNLFTRGPASLIINEVVGTQESILNGYIEVFGSKDSKGTEIILANSNGITCKGCGFIDTSRVTLATGKTMWEQNDFVGLSVKQGQITFEGLGANIEKVSAFDLVTRRVRLNSPIQAKKIGLYLGVEDFNYKTQQFVKGKEEKNTPPINSRSIDASALGSMYADSIYIESREEGFGVMMSGELASHSGDLIIKSKGEIVLKDKIMAKNGSVQLEADGKIESQRIYSSKDVQIISKGDIQANDVIEGMKVLLETKGIFALRDKGSVQSENTKIMSYDIKIPTANQIVALESLEIDTNVFSVLNGTIYIGKEKDNQDKKENISIQNSTQLSFPRNDSSYKKSKINITAKDTTTHLGYLIADKDLEIISVGNFINQNIIKGSGGVKINTNQDFKNKGSIESVGNMLLRFGSFDNKGSIKSTGILNIETQGDFINTGILQSEGKFDIRAIKFVNENLSHQNISNLYQDAKKNLSLVNIYSKNELHIQAKDVVNKGVVQSEKNMVWDVGSFQNENKILSNSILKLSGQDFKNTRTGLLYNSADMTLKFRTFSLQEGEIFSGYLKNGTNRNDILKQGRLNIFFTSGDFENDGIIGADKQLKIYYSGDGDDKIVNRKILFSNGTMELYFHKLENTNGASILADKDMIFSRNADRDKATSISNISADIISNYGKIEFFAKHIINKRENSDYGKDNFSLSEEEQEVYFNSKKPSGFCENGCDTQTIELETTKIQLNKDIGKSALIQAALDIHLQAKFFNNIASDVISGASILFPSDVEIVNETLISYIEVKSKTWVSRISHSICKGSSVNGYCPWGYRDFYSREWDSNGIFLDESKTKKGSVYSANLKAQNAIENVTFKIREGEGSLKNGLNLDFFKEVFGYSGKLDKNLELKSIPEGILNLLRIASENNSLPQFIDIDIHVQNYSQGPFQIVVGEYGKPKIETNPLFQNKELYLNSDAHKTLMNGLGLSNHLNKNKLGDAYFDTSLIRKQLTELLNEPLGDVGTDSLEARIQALVGNLVELYQEKDQLPLTFGVSLSAEQIKNLKKDIIWYVNKKVEGVDVLVPQVFLSKNSIDKLEIPKGNTISSKNVNLKTAYIVNAGAGINSNELTMLEATDGGMLNILGSVTSGNNIELSAKKSILNRAGSILGNNVILSANEDIENESLKYGYNPNQNMSQERHFGASIATETTLKIRAGRNFKNVGADIISNGDIQIDVDNDIVLEALKVRSKREIETTSNITKQNSIKNISSNLLANSKLTLLTRKGNFYLKGSHLDIGEVDINIRKGIYIENVFDEFYTSTQSFYSTENTDSLFSKEKISGSITSTTISNQVLSSKVKIKKGGSIRTDGTMSLLGSSLETGDDLLLDVNEFEAKGASDLQRTWTEIQEIKNKMSVDLQGVKLSKEFSHTQVSSKKMGEVCNESCENTLSYKKAILNIGGNLSINSKKDIIALGTEIRSKKSIQLTAKNNIRIGTEMLEDTLEQNTKTKYLSTGVSFMTDLSVDGGILNSIHLAKSERAQGSVLLSEMGNIYARADNKLSIEGSKVESKNGDIDLYAKNQIQINAIAQNSNMSANSLGVDLSLSTNIVQNAVGMANLTIDTKVTGSKHEERSTQYLQSDIHTEKGKLTIASDGDFEMIGGQARAMNLNVDVKRNVLLQSVQDTHSSTSKSYEAQVSIDVAKPNEISGSLEYSQSERKSSWVNQLTSLTGTKNVDIKVGGDVNLIGASIAQKNNDGNDGGNLYLDIGGTLKARELKNINTATSTSVSLGVGGIADPKKISSYGSYKLGLSYENKDKEGLTKATIGKGTLNIRGGIDGPLNRDIFKQEEITRDIQNGFKFKVDMKLISGIAKNVENFKEISAQLKDPFSKTGYTNNPFNIIRNTNEITKNTADILKNTIGILEKFNNPFLSDKVLKPLEGLQSKIKDLGTFTNVAYHVNTTYDEFTSKNYDNKGHEQNSHLENVARGFEKADIRNLMPTLRGLENLTENVSILVKDFSSMLKVVGQDKLSQNFLHIGNQLEKAHDFLYQSDLGERLRDKLKEEWEAISNNSVVYSILMSTIKKQNEQVKSIEETSIYKEVESTIDKWVDTSKEFVSEHAEKTQNYFHYGYFQQDDELERTLQAKGFTFKNFQGPLLDAHEPMGLTSQELDFLKSKVLARKALITPGKDGMGLLQSKNNEELVYMVKDTLMDAYSLMKNNPEAFTQLDPSLQRKLKNLETKYTNPKTGEENRDKINNELEKIAQSTPSEMCNFITYMNAIALNGGTRGNLKEAYNEAVLGGEIGLTSKGNLAFGVASGQWRSENQMKQVYGKLKESGAMESILNTLLRNKKEKQHIYSFEDNPENLLSTLNQSKKQVAIVELTRGHFVNILRDENNKWIYWDHTSKSFSRRGATINSRDIKKVIVFD